MVFIFSPVAPGCGGFVVAFSSIISIAYLQYRVTNLNHDIGVEREYATVTLTLGIFAAFYVILMIVFNYFMHESTVVFLFIMLLSILGLVGVIIPGFLVLRNEKMKKFMFETYFSQM